MSLFCCLGRTRVSFQGRGFLCKEFVTGYIFTVRSWLHLAQPPTWRTTPCRLSATACSVYSQLPSILEAITPSATWGRAVPRSQGTTYHGTKLTWFQKMLAQLPKCSCIYCLTLTKNMWGHFSSLEACKYQGKQILLFWWRNLWHPVTVQFRNIDDGSDKTRHKYPVFFALLSFFIYCPNR
jgi:hypothetical protein